MQRTKFIDNPWKPLDPYSNDSAACEFRRIKAYRVPASLVPKPPQPAKKRGAKAKAPEQPAPMVSFDVFCNQAFRWWLLCVFLDDLTSLGRASQFVVPKSTFLAPAFSEFESILASQTKDRNAAQKKIKASLRAKQLNGEAIPASVDPEEFEQEPVLTSTQQQADVNDYDDGGFGFGDHDDVCIVHMLICRQRAAGLCRCASNGADPPHWCAV